MSSRTSGVRRLGRVVVATVSVAAALVIAPTSAEATHAAFKVSLAPAANGGATATLSDTIMPSNRYLLSLSATGTGTCGLTGPTVQIVDVDIQGPSNPVTAATAGACTLYNATVVYVVTWTGLPGSSGQFPVYCVWAVGQMRCSVTTVSVAVPVDAT